MVKRDFKENVVRGRAFATMEAPRRFAQRFERISGGRLFITRSGAEMAGPALKNAAFGTLHIEFVPDGRTVSGVQAFELNVMELGSKGRRPGGQKFLQKSRARTKQRVVDSQLGTFHGVVWQPKDQMCFVCG